MRGLAGGKVPCFAIFPPTRHFTINPCLYQRAALLDAAVNAAENETNGRSWRLNYWRLWLFDAAVVSAGMLFFLAAHYGTYEFFGAACLMALLPLIPVIVLVGGAGSTVFVLTKAMIEKRSLPPVMAAVLLVGPGLIVSGLCVLLAASQSPGRRLAYICHGEAPTSARLVRVAGYSTFLSEEWLAVFQVGPKEFQTLVAQAGLVPADGFEFKKLLAQSSLKNSKLFQSVPPAENLPCFKRVFKPDQEHQRGSIFAAFDQATSTAVVVREYHD